MNKIEKTMLFLAWYFATVGTGLTVGLGFTILFASCDASQPTQETKIYGIEWVTGPLEGDKGLWESSKEYYLNQEVFDDYTQKKFRVIQLPAGSKVRAVKSGTTKSRIIYLSAPAGIGDTVVGPDGMYHIPK